MTETGDWQGAWYVALGEPHGLLLRASDPQRARQRLYAARARLGDPDLAELEVRIVDLAEGNLVIIKEGLGNAGSSAETIVESEPRTLGDS